MIEKLITILNSQVELSPADEALIREHVTFRTLKNHEYLMREGDIAHSQFIVLDGCIRMFYSAANSEKTSYFFLEGHYIWSGESYYNRTALKENYQALSRTTVAVLRREVLAQLEMNPTFNQFRKAETVNALLNYQKILCSLLTLSSEDRYLELLESKKELIQRVPQKHLASYLRVEPETLCRIKKKVLLRA